MNSFARLVLVLMLAAGVLLTARSHAQVSEAWATADLVGQGTPGHLAVQPTGHLYILGWDNASELSTAKLDPSGAVLWTGATIQISPHETSQSTR